MLNQENNKENQIIAVDYIKRAIKAEIIGNKIRYTFFLRYGIVLDKNKRNYKTYMRSTIEKANSILFKIFGLVKSQNNNLTFDVDEVCEHFMMAIDRSNGKPCFH